MSLLYSVFFSRSGSRLWSTWISITNFISTSFQDEKLVVRVRHY